jgi:hypothetical protein
MRSTRGGEDQQGAAGPQLIGVSALADLHGALRRAGFQVIGPTIRDDAIVLAELASAEDLPDGWSVRPEPGG